MVRLIISVALVTLLTACGGGGSGAPSQSGAAPSAADIPAASKEGAVTLAVEWPEAIAPAAVAGQVQTSSLDLPSRLSSLKMVITVVGPDFNPVSHSFAVSRTASGSSATLDGRAVDPQGTAISVHAPAGKNRRIYVAGSAEVDGRPAPVAFGGVADIAQLGTDSQFVPIALREVGSGAPTPPLLEPLPPPFMAVLAGNDDNLTPNWEFPDDQHGFLNEIVDVAVSDPLIATATWDRETQEVSVKPVSSGAVLVTVTFQDGTNGTHLVKVDNVPAPPLVRPGLTFTLDWTHDGNDRGPDLDLHVIDPDGVEWDFENAIDHTDPELTVDDRGQSGSRSQDTGGGPEEMVWASPPLGTYQVFAQWYDSASDATSADLDIKATVDGVPAISLPPSPPEHLGPPAPTDRTNGTVYDFVYGLSANDVPDGGLRSCLAKFGALATSDLPDLTYLDCRDMGIRDLTVNGPDQMTGLKVALFDGNEITDLVPLAPATALNALSLNNNKISNVTPLAVLTDLVDLSLRGNEISSVSPLTVLLKVKRLNVAENKIDALPAGISDLVVLENLQLANNKIAALPSLSTLTALRLLNLDGNTLTSTGALDGLNALERLDLRNNQITNAGMTPIPMLPKLTDLHLAGNKLTAVPALSGLNDGLPTVLKSVDLSRNEITGVGDLTDSPTQFPSLKKVNFADNPGLACGDATAVFNALNGNSAEVEAFGCSP